MFTAGGLPPLVNAPDVVYEKLFGTKQQPLKLRIDLNMKQGKFESEMKLIIASIPKTYSAWRTLLDTYREKKSYYRQAVYFPYYAFVSLDSHLDSMVCQAVPFFPWNVTEQSLQEVLMKCMVISYFHRWFSGWSNVELILRLHTDWSHLGFFTRATLAAIASSLDFDTFPLYALVHEPCYVQGWDALFGRH